MKRVISLTLLLTLLLFKLNAQEVCEDSETYILDLNTINKCFSKEKSNDKASTLRKNRSISNGSKVNNRFLTIRKKKIASSLFEKVNGKGIKDTKAETSLEVVSLIALEKEFTHKIYDFIAVDKIPVFNKCRYVQSQEEQALCFNKNMMQFINDNVELSDEILEEGVYGEVSVKFVIDTNGDTYNIQVSGPKNAKALKETIIDMVSRLPKFKPAQRDQKQVPVAYEFSLNFS